jgi:hypothetical protein
MWKYINRIYRQSSAEKYNLNDALEIFFVEEIGVATQVAF